MEKLTKAESSDDAVGDHEDGDVGREGGEDEADAGQDRPGDARHADAELVHDPADDRPRNHVHASLKNIPFVTNKNSRLFSRNLNPIL